MIDICWYLLIFDDMCWNLMIYVDCWWYLFVFVDTHWYWYVNARPAPYDTSFSKPEGPSIYRFAHSLRIAYMIHLGSRGPVAYFQLRYPLSSVDSLFIWIDSLWYVSIFVDIWLHLFVFFYMYWSLLIFACICLY